MGLGSGAEREDIPLSAVYTALDVQSAARIGVPSPDGEGRFSDDSVGVSVDLRGEASYLKQLRSRIEAEGEAARQARKDTSLSEPQTFSRRLTAVEATAAVPRLVLLGTAGSGKSSFARHLALCLAGEALGREEANLAKLNQTEKNESLAAELLPWPHGAPLPIYLELRKLVRSEAFKSASEPGAREILAYLVGAYRELETIVPEALGGVMGALVILDGLDETPGSTRERLKAAIAGLARAYPECRMLVTSRPYAYAEGSPWRLEGLGFEDVHLAPLSPSQSTTFIAGWYRQTRPTRQDW